MVKNIMAAVGIVLDFACLALIAFLLVKKSKNKK